MSTKLAKEKRIFNIVLFKPQIPPNTGNIARLCVCCKCKLHLIGPLGFSIDDKNVKRAGLDFWNLLDYEYYPDVSSFVEKNENPERIFLITKFGQKVYWDHQYKKNDYLIFGQETKGLTDFIRDKYSTLDQRLFIPMPGTSRSINLSNSVAIVIYEGLRQLNFKSGSFNFNRFAEKGNDKK
jgi:tRNA (cytidine/uridine-2'-O-)-methyltransferase